MDTIETEEKTMINTKKMSDDATIVASKVKTEETNTTGDTSDSEDEEPEIICSLCAKKFSGFVPYKQHEKSKTHLQTIIKKKLEKKLKQEAIAVESLSEDPENMFVFFIKKPFAVCRPCGKQFSGPESYQQHLLGKTHKRKIMEDKILQEVRENGEINFESLKRLFKKDGIKEKDREQGEDTVDFYEIQFIEDIGEKLTNFRRDPQGSSDVTDSPLDDEQLECKVCEKVFTGLVPYTQHIISKTHDKKLKQIKMMKKLQRKSFDDQYESIQHSDTKDISNIDVVEDMLSCKLCSMVFSGPESAFAHLKSRGHSKKVQLRKFFRENKHLLTSKHSKMPHGYEIHEALSSEVKLSDAKDEIISSDGSDSSSEKPDAQLEVDSACLSSTPSTTENVAEIQDSPSSEVKLGDTKDEIISSDGIDSVSEKPDAQQEVDSACLSSTSSTTGNVSETTDEKSSNGFSAATSKYKKYKKLMSGLLSDNY